jgi:hypothetical protein
LLERVLLPLHALLPGQEEDRFFWCEYYNHCRRVRCVDPRTTFQKNHDLDLKLPRRDDRYYLVQIRTPLPAIISWYERSLELGWDDGLEDTRESWLSFFRQRMEFFARFVDKWVAPGETDNLIIVAYEQYLEDPIRSLAKVIPFFDPRGELDPQTIRSRAWDMQKARIPSSFRYYDESLEQTLNSLVPQYYEMAKAPFLLQADQECT